MVDKLSPTQKVFSYAMLALLALAILFPIYFMITVSLKTPKDIYRTHPGHPVPVLFQKSVTQFVTSRPVAAAMGFAIDFDDQ